MADDKNNQYWAGQTIGPANGKDVLYGWLVGRAAADLGLAQAIAASEAQRAEQLKRLEEALLGRMRELQTHQSAAGSSADSPEVERLKDQVQQFSERQNFLEAQQLTSGQLEAQLAAKIRQLEAHIEQPPTALSSHEVSALRAEIAGLRQRIDDAGAAAAHEPSQIDNRLVQEQIVDIVREHTEAMKAQLLNQLPRQADVESEFKVLDSSFQKKIDGLQQEIREKAALMRLRDGELSDVRAQIAGIAQRLDYVAATPPPEVRASEREAERALWQRDFDERLTVRLRELGDEIRGKLHGVTSAKVDQEQFRGETLALTARIAELEQSNRNADAGAATEARETYQATVALRGEVAALKSAVLEQQRAPDEDKVRTVEAMLREQIHQVRQQIAEHQSDLADWQNQFKELPGDVQSLRERQVQPETLAQQAYALVSQEAAQIRAGLKADVLAIEAQLEARLNERRARDGALQSLEDAMNGRMRELHHQLAQALLTLDRRDGELRELKAQVQALTQRGGGAMPPAPVNRFDGLAEAIAEALPGGFAASPQPMAQPPVLAPASLDSGTNLFQPALPGNGLMTDAVKLPAGDLHDRLSAEIERKRAELREKSGRWKVRQ